MSEGSLTRLVILDVLQTGLSSMPAPSLAHFLLGFDLKKGVSKSQLQPPNIAAHGSSDPKSCLHRFCIWPLCS